MSRLVEFLLARLDEDQAAAEAAKQIDPAPWRAEATDDGPGPEFRAVQGAGVVVAADGVPLWDCEGSFLLCMTAPTTRHVARWDPDQVLREIASKRQLIEKLCALREVVIDEDPRWHRRKADEMLMLLAMPYTSDPDILLG